MYHAAIDSEPFVLRPCRPCVQSSPHPVFRVALMASSSNSTINNIAAEAIRTFQVTDVPVRLDPRLCAVDPYNRDGTLISGKQVHELLWKILKAGFSFLKCVIGFVVDLPSNRLPAVLKHNNLITRGDDLLPDVPEVEIPKFTVLHTNHFVMIHRCFVYKTQTTEKVRKLGITTPDGRLSLALLEGVDKEFHDYLVAGHRAIRLRAELLENPSLVKAIINGFNHDVSMGDTEMQLMLTIRSMVHEGDGCKNGALKNKDIEDLQLRFPHYHHHIEPFAKFVYGFGAPDTPFVDNLDIYYSEYVQAEAVKSEAVFWQALCEFPFEFGWAVIAFAKDNYAVDKIQFGLCKGVPVTKLKKAQKEVGKLRDLHNFLKQWREETPGLSAMSEKGKARVLGQLDILSSRVLLHGHIIISSPANSTEELDLKKMAHVSLVCKYNLLAETKKENGQVDEKEFPDLSSLVVKPKAKPSETGKSESYRPEYANTGELVNKMELYQGRGYKVSHEVMTDRVVSYMHGAQKLRLQERTSGRITAVTESCITIDFQRIGIVVWSWHDFPSENVIVTKGKDIDKNVFLPTSFYPITSTPAYKTMMLKAGLIWAMRDMHERLQKCQNHTYPEGAKDAGGVPLRFKLKPKKGIFAGGIVAKGRPLVLLPMTTSVTVVKAAEAHFLKTSIQVEPDSVLALGSVWQDPLEATSLKPGIVEYFWHVRRSDQETECNMALSSSTVAFGGRVSMSNEALFTCTAGMDINFPIMISTKNIKVDEELVCFYKETGLRPVKKARIS